MDQRADCKTSNSFIVSLDSLFFPLLGKLAFWEELKQRFLALIPFFGGRAAAPPLGTPIPRDISIFNLLLPRGFVQGVIHSAGRQPFPFLAFQWETHSPAPGAKGVLLLFPT